MTQAIHGGALVMGSSGHLVPYLTLLSHFMSNLLDKKQSPLPILSFEYRLAPECVFPCQTVDVSFIINKYLNQELGIDLNKIYLLGDSSGASLSLLLMQKIASNVNHLSKYNIGGAVLISPGCDWTLSNGNGSWSKNAKYDPIIFYDSIALYRNYVFGEYEQYQQCQANEQCQEEIKVKYNSPKISPCFGSFKGLPSMYITVSQLECLFDDALNIYNKANEANIANKNINYFLEINKGSSLHQLPLMAGIIPEATKTLHNIAHFLVNLTTSSISSSS